MLVFRQLFDPASSTYTYLLADGRSGAAARSPRWCFGHGSNAFCRSFRAASI
jgi:hypothetical protein